MTPLYAGTSGGRTGAGAGSGADAGADAGSGADAGAGPGTGAGAVSGTIGAEACIWPHDAGTGDGAAASRGSLFFVARGALASTSTIVSSLGGFSLSETFFGAADGPGTGDGCGNGCDDDGGCGGDGGESGGLDSGDDFLGAYFVSLAAEARLCDDAIWRKRVRRRRWLL